MPQRIQFEPVNQIDFEPIQFEPIEEPPKQQKGLLRRFWDTATTPVNEQLGIERKVKGGLSDVPGAILDIGRNFFTGGPARSAEMLKGFGQGALEGIGQFSPLDWLDVATGFGKAPLVRGANRLISGAVTGQGAQHIAEGEGLTGAAEVAGGLVGMLAPGARPAAKATVDNVPARVDVLPPEAPRLAGDRSLPPSTAPQPNLLPALGETTPASPRFYQGSLGVADATKQYPIDLPGSRNPGGSPFDYPESLGTISPVQAAESGLGSVPVYKDYVDPVVHDPVLGALLPESMKPKPVMQPVGALPMDVPKTTPTGKPVPPGKKVPKKLTREGVIPLEQPDVKLENPAGGLVREAPSTAKELPYDPNRFDATPVKEKIFGPLLREQDKISAGIKPDPNAVPPQQKLIDAIRGSQPLTRAEYKAYGGRLQPVRATLEQKDVTGLFEAIRKNDRLTETEQELTRAGLVKILGKNSVGMPSKPEMVMLNRVFGDELTNLLRSREGIRGKIGNALQETFNLPRALMATADYSAPFRQGLPLIHKKAFWTSFDDMLKAGWSDEGYRAVKESIEANPNYKNAVDHGLEVTDAYGDLTKREERFMSTWAEKIPGVGRVAKASNRAYTAFLNKVRMDTYNSLMDKASKADPMMNRDVASRAIADFVNTATGRGSLGRFEKAAPVLNATLFSPRLQASRIDMYRRVFYPPAYVEMPKGTRLEALKSLFSVVGTGGMIGALAKEVGDNVDVETDPRNSDFGKIQIGNTRIDPYGGFQQYAVLASRLLTGKTASALTGNEREFGSGYNDPNEFIVGARFLRSKAHPAVSFAIDMAMRSTPDGQPFDLKSGVVQRMIPIMLQDLKELHDEDPNLLPLVIPSMFGMGVQTFGQKDDWSK